MSVEFGAEKGRKDEGGRRGHAVQLQAAWRCETKRVATIRIVSSLRREGGGQGEKAQRIAYKRRVR